MNVRALAIVLVFIIVGLSVFSAFMLLYSSPPSPSFSPTVIDTASLSGSECTPGERASCSAGACEGEKTCLHGVWSQCRLVTECASGEERFCASGACDNGVQACNECGRWGECIPPPGD